MKKSSKQKKEQLNNLFAVYNKRLEALYNDYVNRLTSLGLTSLDNADKMFDKYTLFNFNNFPDLKARLDDIFEDYFQDNIVCIKNGMTDGVALAFKHDSNALGGFSMLSDKTIHHIRETAAETFIRSRIKSEKGLNLSQNIWNYCQQTKSEFEMGMSNVIADGLKKGISAEELGRKLRTYLNNPDMMYRRYHTTIALSNGTKKDIVTWRRRRIIDGKVRFVEEPLEKVGQGVYRSARKNALRVARTEINAAYLRGHNERWRNEPFVIGQHIHVSPQHVIDDICNEIEGFYPKDFIFAGWHPACLCTSDPIMIDGEEKKEFYRRLMAGEDMSNYVSPFAIKDVPERYKQYIEDNEEAIMRAFEKDKLAWHLVDNKKYWQRYMSPENQEAMGVKSLSSKERVLQAAEKRHAERTQEQIKRIQQRWDKHRRDYYNNLVSDIIGGKSVFDIKSSALQERYFAIRQAIKEKKSASEISALVDRFKRGYQTKMVWMDRKIAMNVLNTAQKYAETNTSKVKEALRVANYSKARQEAKVLAKKVQYIREEEAKLSKLIPDVNSWHKQFSLQELQQVYNAVENKLISIKAYGNLTDQKNNIHFEIDWVKKHCTTKYKTWKVSVAAYEKQEQTIDKLLQIEKIKAELPQIKQYVAKHNGAKKLAGLLNDAEIALSKSNSNEIESKLNALNKNWITLKKSNASRAIKKTILSDPELANLERYLSKHYTEKFTVVSQKSYEDVMRMLGNVTKDAWRNATDAQRAAFPYYTNSSSHSRRILTNVGLGKDEPYANLMDAILDKIKTKKDLVLRSGQDFCVAEYVFGKEFRDLLQAGNLTRLNNEFAGAIGLNKAYMSTSFNEHGGFSKQFEVHIFAPKGTHCMNLNELSDFGQKRGTSWDGQQFYPKWVDKGETEIFLHRGYRWRFLRAEKGVGLGGRDRIYVQLLNREITK